VAIGQIEPLLECMGVADARIDGREADDVIASIATHVDRARGERCLIFSDDKDFVQLVCENISLARRSMHGTIMTPNECDMMGLDYGERYLHIKALMGDTGDNIRGLYMIGEVKARKIVNCIPDVLSSDEPDWDRLASAEYKAMVRAGRKLLHPAPPKNKDATKFAKDLMKRLGRPLPRDLYVDEDSSLQAAQNEAIRCLDLVELDREMFDADELEFPPVNVESIPAMLRKLDLLEEHDLLSSIYTLAGAMDPSFTPPRMPQVRAGDRITDSEPMPDDLF
jgi:5'-3' exonuclease